MNKEIIKSTVREIKTSFGRYMAILLIVALGVGFFSGLKVSYDAMVHSADDYWDRLNMFDYQFLSTVGYDEDAEQTIAEEDGVSFVEGSKSADIIMMNEKGIEAVMKTHEIPQNINQLDLMAGRMPKKDNECLADHYYFKEEDIGKTIKVSNSNEEEDSDKFKTKEFTIVGIVRSPIYTFYQRGATALGNGSIHSFLYVKESAYDMDYDTELYVLLEKDAGIYTSEYEKLVDKHQKKFETLNEKVALQRYNRIYTDLMDEIEEAESTLQDKKTEGANDLKDALDEIVDGKQKINDGKSQIAKAKDDFTKNETKLQKNEKAYKKGLKDYKKNKATYDKGKKAYDKGVAAYNKEKATYQNGLLTYQTGKAAYDQNEAAYKKAKELYEQGKDFLTLEERKVKEQELAGWKSKLDETNKTLQVTKLQLDTAKVTLDSVNIQLNTEGTKLRTADKKLKKAKKQLTAAGEQIKSAKKQLKSGKNKLTKEESTLIQSSEELDEGQVKYDDAKKEYDEKIADAEHEIKDAKKEIGDFEKPETYVLDRKSNMGYASFENDSKIIMGIAKVFPIFFFLVAALVCMTTMTRMIEEQRTQIGILKALGYSNQAIIGKYMIYSGSAAMIGAIGGFLIGTWAFSIVIWTAYQILYDMGPLLYVFDSGLALISILTALVCSAGTTWIACYQELQDMAATLMRPKAPKVGKRVFLERIPFLWNRMKFLDKVSVRNLFRYKKRFFMMIIGVSGCTALLVTGFGVRDSISDIASTQFNQISLYDMAVRLNEEEEIKVDGMKEHMLMLTQSLDLDSEDGIKSINLLVPKNEKEINTFIDMHTEEGEKVSFPKKNEVVITQKMAEQNNIKVGDQISLYNMDKKHASVTVSGIYITYFNQYMLMSAGTYQSMFGEKVEYNTMYVNLEENADAHQVSANLMKNEKVTMATLSSDMKSQIEDMLSSLDYVVILVIFCAAMLAFIVIYNLNNINITERIREIATIKVLGFYKEETNSYVFRENFVLTLIGSLVGLLLGHYLHAFVMAQIKIESISFAVRVTGFSFLISVLLTLLFNQLVNLFMSKKLEKIDMAESLKSVE